MVYSSLTTEFMYHLLVTSTLLWDALDMDNFYFLFLLFSDFIGILFYFSFFFSFGQWRGMWHCSHMTCHMMWCHRPRRWWKDLEDDIKVSRSLTVDLIFIFTFHFILFFLFFFVYFLFLEQLGLGFISHAVTSVTNWWCGHKTDHET